MANCHEEKKTDGQTKKILLFFNGLGSRFHFLPVCLSDLPLFLCLNTISLSLSLFPSLSRSVFSCTFLLAQLPTQPAATTRRTSVLSLFSFSPFLLLAMSSFLGRPWVRRMVRAEVAGEPLPQGCRAQLLELGVADVSIGCNGKTSCTTWGQGKGTCSCHAFPCARLLVTQ